MKSILKAKVIGSGAAGNKAAICLIERGIIPQENVLLINSTLKDIPEKYREFAVAISQSEKDAGCGKERSKSKELTANSINEGELDLDGFIESDDDLVIGISSTEGGTGAGNIPFIGSYLKRYVDTFEDEDVPREDQKRINYHVIALNGFGEDARGYKNTVDFFKDLEEDFSVEAIHNSKFLDEARGSKPDAERLANEEVCRKVATRIGLGFIDSDQNIDYTDLYKTSCLTPGFSLVEKRNIGKIKNIDEFNSIITDMIDTTKSMEVPEPSQKRLAVILNIPKSSENFIDYTYKVLKERLGSWFEVFTQKQFSEDSGEEPYIAFISSGLKMPINEIKETYSNYKEESAKVNKADDTFFAFMDEIEDEEEDMLFNANHRSSVRRKNDDLLDAFDKKKNKKQPSVLTKPASINVVVEGGSKTNKY